MFCSLKLIYHRFWIVYPIVFPANLKDIYHRFRGVYMEDERQARDCSLSLQRQIHIRYLFAPLSGAFILFFVSPEIVL